MFASNTVTYTYNDDGIRTSKNVSGIKHIYHLDGSRIVSEEWGDGLYIYLYDAEGLPIGMQYRKNSMAEGEFYTYWYEKNLQGDIVAIYSDNGVKIMSYSYDAWGNVTKTRNTINQTTQYAINNPFLYRGYYYDVDTKLYYLNSRYYDPQMCRFINADGQLNGGLLGYNQFAYCDNNPINLIDPFGQFGVLTALACVAVVAFTMYSCTASEDKLVQQERKLEKSMTVKYDVPVYNQGSTNLCWAYCQTMIESYQSGERLSKNMANARAKEIAIARNGEKSWNRGGWPANLGTKIAADKIKNIDDLYTILCDNGPVYAYYNDNAGSAHLVVVTGVNLYKGVVYTNNPWGVRGEQTYHQFMNSFAKKWYQTGNTGYSLGAIYLVE